MGAAVFVIGLAGLVLPIVLILTAVVVDLLVLAWFVWHWGYDRMMPRVGHYLSVHGGAAFGRYLRAHHLLPRPH